MPSEETLPSIQVMSTAYPGRRHKGNIPKQSQPLQDPFLDARVPSEWPFSVERAFVRGSSNDSIRLSPRRVGTNKEKESQQSLQLGARTAPLSEEGTPQCLSQRAVSSAPGWRAGRVSQRVWREVNFFPGQIWALLCSVLPSLLPEAESCICSTGQ